MKKLKEWIKNNSLYILTILFSTIIVFALFILKEVTPLGAKSLLCIDFYHQYGPMLAGLYDKLKHFGNLIYSFDLGLGLPYYRNFMNYLSSPLNLMMLLFSHKNVITSYSFIIGFKAVLSSFTMIYYLSKKFKNKNLYLIPIGILYAFSAYYQSYYWNIMWIDGMIFIPLITLGIENIINNNKWKFYTIVLAIMLFSNYFIGYMLCIYSVVYFICYLFYKTKFNKKSIKPTLKKVWLFTKGSLLAGGLVAILLIPLFLTMKSISATGGEIPTSLYYDFTLVDFLKGHLTGVTTTIFASDDITNPNVSCGILSVFLLLLYLVNLDISWKNKVCYLALLGFYILSFFFAPLDYIMHAFHVPNDLPYRFSFIYSFILMVIGTYSLLNIKKNGFSLNLLVFLLLISTLFLISFDNWPDLSKNMIYINIILLTLYFLFYIVINYIDVLHKILYLGLIFIAAVDVLISLDNNWDVTQVLEVFYDDYDDIEDILEYYKKNDTDKFYRTEKINSKTLNDGTWYNYHGVNTFSSMAYEQMAILQKNLGLPGNNINSYYYVQTTPIYDLMFDIKYFIGNSNDLLRYTDTYSNKQNSYRFNYTLGLIYGVNDSILNWNTVQSNPFDVQNDFIKYASGVENVLTEPTLINVEEIFNSENEIILKYTYENPFDNLYFYTNDQTVDFFIIGQTVYYRNENYNDYKNIEELNYVYVEDYKEENIVNINSTEDVITIYVAYNNYENQNFYISMINNDNFLRAYDYLHNYQMRMTNFKESKIKGKITLDDEMIVYTSIPYDDGWTVYANGKKVEKLKLVDNLLAFKLNKGTYDIKITYHIPYFKISALISMSSLLILIFNKEKIKKFNLFKKKKEKRK